MSLYRLSIMTFLHFIAMYVLMYAMVDRLGNVVLNLNQLYMAAIMTAPMLFLEGLLMGSMYSHKVILTFVMVFSVALFVLFFVFLRLQIAVDDRELLRSMIPHHAGAILMCEKATLTNPEVITLCNGIVASQEAEIDQMKQILGSGI